MTLAKAKASSSISSSNHRTEFLYNPLFFSSGAFAKRDLPKNTIITGTPLLVFPDMTWFDMYESRVCPDGITEVPKQTSGPIQQQLVLNYCFSHSESTVVLCPVSYMINSVVDNMKIKSPMLSDLQLLCDRFVLVRVGSELYKSQPDKSKR